LPNWTDANVSQEFGDRWLKDRRSCILFIPSIVAPLDNNILINEFHPLFPNIVTSLDRPVIWDRRLFLDTED
jgi:RES domain-containing protein